MVQRYIEYDLPLKEISHYSALEKNIRHGNPASLLQWWARRPLTSSRTTNFAALIDLPESQFERNNLKELIIDISKTDNIKLPISAGIKKAYQWGGSGTIILCLSIFKIDSYEIIFLT